MVELTEGDVLLAFSTAGKLVDSVRNVNSVTNEDLSCFGDGPKIIAQPKNEAWGNYEYIDASFNPINNDIRVRIPNQGHRNTGGASHRHVSDYVATVIIHEWVHYLQDLADHERFIEEVKKQSVIQKEISRSGGASESYHPYYMMDFEIEAHSAQICVEMKLSGLEFINTKTWKRIEGRLRGIAHLEEIVTNYEMKTSEFWKQLFGAPELTE